jgi:UDP-N-acetyl-2-amino-2-deoxyglucuronate dehydrogenase
MPGDRVRMGIIGCGAAGLIEARAIVNSHSARLVMVADIEPRAARQAGEKFGVPHVHSAEELLASSEVDAVSIALPHHLHLPVGLLAAAAGKHAIIEKPLTTSASDALELIEAFERARRTLSVWLERRYCPFVEPARRFLAEGHIGRIIYVTLDVMGHKPRSYWAYGMRNESFPSNWRKSWTTSGGGVLLMNAVHQIDVVRYITGLEVAEVFAKMRTFYHDVEVEDTLAAVLEFEGGALGRIDSSCAAFGAGAFPIDIQRDRIYGVDGHIVLGSPLETYDRIWYHRKQELPRYTVTEMKTDAIDDYARRLLDGGRDASLAREAVRNHEVIAALYESARSGRPVRLNQ